MIPLLSDLYFQGIPLADNTDLINIRLRYPFFFCADGRGIVQNHIIISI